MARYVTSAGRRLVAMWTVATLVSWTGSPLARAAGVSLHDRGPCPDVVDGVCIPNRRNFGWYAPKWRQWPGDVPAPVRDEKSVIQRDVPEEVPPFELPPPQEEADPPEAQAAPRGLPAEPPATEPAPDAVPEETGDAPPALPPELQDGAAPQGTPVDPDLLLPVEPDPFPTAPPVDNGAALPGRRPTRVGRPTEPTAAAPLETVPASLNAPDRSPRAESNPLRREADRQVRAGQAAPRAFVAASPPRRLSSWTPSRRPNPLRSE